MWDKKYFKAKKVAVIGLARSGQASARLLRSLGAKVLVSDIGNNKKLHKAAHDLEKEGISVELGVHSESLIADTKLIVLSPGVPNDSAALKIAKTHKIPVISEIELGFRLVKCPIVAVTGTNGKTTVTTLIGEILKKKFKRVFVLGNIGKPFCSHVLEVKKDDVVVLEVSSFQLEHIDRFRPKVAVVLNFTPDHLDWHKDLEKYLCAKKRIFLNQSPDDYAVLNADDEAVKSMAASTRAQVIYFSKMMKKESGLSELNHNFLAALVTAKIFGMKKEEVLPIFEKFKGVEHRLEFVRSIDGVEFINDSKATNIDSTLWAFDNIKRPIILIAGGRDKGSDFIKIRHIMKEKVILLITLGEAKDKMLRALKNVLPTKEAGDLSEAINLAKQMSKKGDCVLLSPMCASFDMFENYEQRGMVFKDLVKKL